MEPIVLKYESLSSYPLGAQPTTFGIDGIEEHVMLVFFFFF